MKEGNSHVPEFLVVIVLGTCHAPCDKYKLYVPISKDFYELIFCNFECLMDNSYYLISDQDNTAIKLNEALLFNAC